MARKHLEKLAQIYEEQIFENRMLKSYIKSWPDEEGQ